MAVNTLFKIYYTFDFKIPILAKNIFLFLAKKYYKVDDTTKVPSCVIDLIDKL